MLMRILQTMTVLLSFVLAIVLHPHVLVKAQAEIDRVIGNGRLPDDEDRNSLPDLECVLKEVYRYIPRSSFTVIYTHCLCIQMESTRPPWYAHVVLP